ncbi:MAG: DUF309 domain-containing protein [Candidatus Marinimicrobia bacterium]|nr:DUF309 domain-containing protein [Candidatus Neomarinimicrobiota bacterium]
MATPDRLPVSETARADTLFRQGVAAFNGGDFFDAHEYWEDLWRDYQLPDKTFVQGLIQVAVGCFHLTNDNLNGARGLFAKCLPKLEPCQPTQRGLDVTALVTFVKHAQEQVNTIQACADFDWSHRPHLTLEEG